MVRATFFHPVSGISEIIHDESELTDGEVFLTLEVAVELAQLFDELREIVNPNDGFRQQPFTLHKSSVNIYNTVGWRYEWLTQPFITLMGQGTVPLYHSNLRQ